MHNKDSNFWATFQPNLHFFFRIAQSPLPTPFII